MPRPQICCTIPTMGFSLSVPGRDDYSVQQGEVSSEPGGVEAGGVDALIGANDRQSRVPRRPGGHAAAATWGDARAPHQQAAVRDSQPQHDADGKRVDDSVLDRDAEARWVKRLFVADNSALANGIGGPNPTLTTQALATRTAESIFTRYFGGDPWVRRQSPVSSIDDAVTRAVIDRGL